MKSWSLRVIRGAFFVGGYFAGWCIVRQPGFRAFLHAFKERLRSYTPTIGQKDSWKN
jgi:hypothetical protein